MGSIHEVQMVTTFTAYDVRYFIYPEQVGSLDNIPMEIKEQYLENNAKYQINHPVIQNALKEAIGQETNPYWIPVDPSGGDKISPRDQANSFGFLKNQYLITTQSGGGSETVDWTYNSNAFWTTEPKTNIVIEYFADWE